MILRSDDATMELLLENQQKIWEILINIGRNCIISQDVTMELLLEN